MTPNFKWALRVNQQSYHICLIQSNLLFWKMIYIFSPTIIKTQFFFLSPPFLFLCDYQASYFTENIEPTSYVNPLLFFLVHQLDCITSAEILLCHFCRSVFSLLLVGFYQHLELSFIDNRSIKQYQFGKLSGSLLQISVLLPTTQ